MIIVHRSSTYESNSTTRNILLPQSQTLMALLEGESLERQSDKQPSKHFSMPVSTALDSLANNDSEEWEYEYSTTDTETYYLTLDLTTPSIPCARPNIPRTGRGGYKSAWINPGLRRPKRNLGPAPTISLPKKDTGTSPSTPVPKPPAASPAFGDGNAEEEDAASDDEDIQERSHSVQDSPEKTNVDGAIPESQRVNVPEKIQILDLHTENPIIIYKAHTFSCSWAENIGTELLFSFHDPERPLPSLRSLPDNVELLAASSARLISKSVKITPKASPKDENKEGYIQRQVKNPISMDPKPVSITIPVGPGASASRKEQARFLERLMEIKQNKGEEDSVTVVAHRRLYPAGWRALLREKRAEERLELRALVDQGGSVGEEAAKRLEEMDNEDKAAEEEKQKEDTISQKAKAGRKPKDEDEARPAKRARGAVLFRRPRGGRARTNLFNDNRQNSRSLVDSGTNEQEALSTPTPRRWDEQ